MWRMVHLCVFSGAEEPTTTKKPKLKRTEGNALPYHTLATLCPPLSCLDHTMPSPIACSVGRLRRFSRIGSCVPYHYGHQTTGARTTLLDGHGIVM